MAHFFPRETNNVHSIETAEAQTPPSGHQSANESFSDQIQFSKRKNLSVPDADYLSTQMVSIPDAKYKELRTLILHAVYCRCISFGVLKRINGKLMHYSQLSKRAKMCLWTSTQAVHRYCKNTCVSNETMLLLPYDSPLDSMVPTSTLYPYSTNCVSNHYTLHLVLWLM